MSIFKENSINPNCVLSDLHSLIDLFMNKINSLIENNSLKDTAVLEKELKAVDQSIKIFKFQKLEPPPELIKLKTQIIIDIDNSKNYYHELNSLQTKLMNVVQLLSKKNQKVPKVVKPIQQHNYKDDKPHTILKNWLMEALIALGGAAYSTDVYKYILDNHGEEFKKEWLSNIKYPWEKSGWIYWKRIISSLIYRQKKAGIIKSNTSPGYWVLNQERNEGQ